jgi:hypothetical protein
MALMVVPSARMPAHDGMATPSKGGREGIVWTDVSRRPEAYRTGASFLYYSFVDKVITQLNHQPRRAGRLYRFFKRVNGAMAASPLLIIGDSCFGLSRRAEGEAAHGSSYPQIAVALNWV